MSPSRASAPRAVERLRCALETVARAIVDARLDDLVSAEAELGTALAAVCSVVEVPEADRPALLAEVRAARLALARCRSLGAAINHVADATLAAQGRQNQYDRAGLTASPLSTPPSMDVRA